MNSRGGGCAGAVADLVEVGGLPLAGSPELPGQDGILPAAYHGLIPFSAVVRGEGRESMAVLEGHGVRDVDGPGWAGLLRCHRLPLGGQHAGGEIRDEALHELIGVQDFHCCSDPRSFILPDSLSKLVARWNAGLDPLLDALVGLGMDVHIPLQQVPLSQGWGPWFLPCPSPLNRLRAWTRPRCGWNHPRLKIG
jgi:hypothetical protein